MESNYSDSLVNEFKTTYKLEAPDFWQLKRGGKSQWIIKHNALEKVAAQDNITWTLEVLNYSPDVVVKCIAQSGDRVIESLGESTGKNTVSQFPYAMAEKRAVDRCILKLLNAHAYIYSDSESVDFKEPTGNKVKSDAHNKLNKVAEAQLNDQSKQH